MHWCEGAECDTLVCCKSETLATHSRLSFTLTTHSRLSQHTQQRFSSKSLSYIAHNTLQTPATQATHEKLSQHTLDSRNTRESLFTHPRASLYVSISLVLSLSLFLSRSVSLSQHKRVCCKSLNARVLRALFDQSALHIWGGYD